MKYGTRGRRKERRIGEKLFVYEWERERVENKVGIGKIESMETEMGKISMKLQLWKIYNWILGKLKVYEMWKICNSKISGQMEV